MGQFASILKQLRLQKCQHLLWIFFFTKSTFRVIMGSETRKELIPWVNLHPF